MVKKIRKKIVRLDVVEVDELMACSKTKFPLRLVGKSDLWEKCGDLYTCIDGCEIEKKIIINPSQRPRLHKIESSGTEIYEKEK